MDSTFHRPNGMQGFFIIWLGQIVSGIASSITAVALPIWIFGITSSGTAVGLLEFFFFGSYLIVVLFAGVLIDRYNRKMMMLVYDFLSLSSIAILLALQTTGNLEVWHLYVSAIFQGAGYAFQSPSYSAAITTMVPRAQFVRANGLMSLLNDGPEVFGPLLAGGLYLMVGLSGLLVFNMLALIVSIGTLLFVEVPSMHRSHDGEHSPHRFIREAIYGVKYIFQRPGLLGLQLIFFTGNLFSGMALSVAALYPMLLLRTGNDAETVGIVQSVGALAAVIAGVFIAGWGGIKRPVRAILLGWLLSSLLGLTLLGVGRVFIIWLIAMAINSLFEPVVNVAMDSFLQTKVPPDLQGRVFSASDFLAQALVPFTPLLAGFFGDKIFEPAMQDGGALIDTFGWLVGTGPGAGFGLLIFICGISGTLVGLSGYLIGDIRNADKLLPDYRATPPVGMVRRPQSMYFERKGAVHEPHSLAPSKTVAPVEKTHED